MHTSENLVRDIFVLIFLAILFPAVSIFIFATIFQGILIGLVIASIIFFLFVYLDARH